MDPSEAQYMSQMHYFCLLEGMLGPREPESSPPPRSIFIELPRRVLLRKWASASYYSRKPGVVIRLYGPRWGWPPQTVLGLERHRSVASIPACPACPCTPEPCPPRCG